MLAVFLKGWTFFSLCPSSKPQTTNVRLLCLACSYLPTACLHSLLMHCSLPASTVYLSHISMSMFRTRPIGHCSTAILMILTASKNGWMDGYLPRLITSLDTSNQAHLFILPRISCLFLLETIARSILYPNSASFYSYQAIPGYLLSLLIVQLLHSAIAMRFEVQDKIRKYKVCLIETLCLISPNYWTFWPSRHPEIVRQCASVLNSKMELFK